MIPEEKQPVVERALQGAFGVKEYEEIRPLMGGLSSALAFQISVRGKPYLLKILRKEIISDPRQEFAIMQIASEAGLAPRVWFADAEERVVITDFIEGKPFQGEMALLAAGTIRKIHALQGYHKTIDYFGAMNGLVSRFQAARLLPDDATAELFQRFARLRQVNPWQDTERVPSHNDVKPQNIIFDGQRIWLVDWEAAFLNDRYVDLSIAANFFVNKDAEEERYLEAYFGAPPSQYQRARFYLMRQALSVFYMALLLLEAARAGLAPSLEKTPADFWQYHQDLISGKIPMLAPEEKLEYGLLHLRQALENMRNESFADAMRVVSEHPIN